jgi:hypothetical protein
MILKRRPYNNMILYVCTVPRLTVSMQWHRRKEARVSYVPPASLAAVTHTHQILQRTSYSLFESDSKDTTTVELLRPCSASCTFLKMRLWYSTMLLNSTFALLEIPKLQYERCCFYRIMDYRKELYNSPRYFWRSQGASV